MNLVFSEVGHIAGEGRGVMVHRLAAQDPSHVRPPLAVERGVRIAVFVRELVMNAMRGYPENRAAFERQGRAPGEEVLHPLGRFVTAMGEQAMVAHADAEAAGN